MSQRAAPGGMPCDATMVRAVVLSLLLFGARQALACPTCGCANPALTTIGADQPFAGRLRFAATVRAWQQTEGTAEVNQTQLRELRTDLTASWAPLRRLTLMLNVPLQLRERTDVSLARERGFGLGEVDVSARFLVVGAEGFRPRHLLSLVATARLPTSPTLHAADGTPLAVDAQLGPGAFVPGVGVFYSAFIKDQWSTFVSLLGDVPLQGRYGLRVGPGVNLFATAQYQPWRFLGFRAGVDGRYEFTSFQDGQPDDSQAGLVLQAVADLVIAPTSSFLIFAGARVPFLQLRGGPVTASPIFLVTLVLDV